MSRHRITETPRAAAAAGPHRAATPGFTGTVLAVTCIGWGGAYAVGGPATAAALRLMDAVLPIQAWGALLALGGVLVLLRFRSLGYFLSTVVTLVWALFSGITLASGTATGVGLPLYVGFAALLGRCLYRERTEARRVPGRPLADTGAVVRN